MIGVTLLLGAMACTGGGHSVGEPCSSSADCGGGLQCLDRVCEARCLHHVDCGDGYTCADGECHMVDAVGGGPCDSELECGPGLTCRLKPVLARPLGTCQPHTSGSVPGATCATDLDCRGGACALGHCLELCAEESECQRGWTCAGVPRITDDAALWRGDFAACLPDSGTISFELPLDPDALAPTIQVPVPTTAVSFTAVLEVADPFQRIGATFLEDPVGNDLYKLPVDAEEFFANRVRHVPAPGVSTIKVPGSPQEPLKPGAYALSIGVFRDDGGPPSTARRVRIVEKLGLGTVLDLHFYFADLRDHPCADRLGVDLDATSAAVLPGFQDEYLAELRAILGPALAPGITTYANIDTAEEQHPELAGLEVGRAGELFALNQHRSGVAVFFVRSIAPAGLQIVVGGTPGAPLPGTRASGIAVALDSLCYRDWRMLARQTAHAVARHLGLFRNVEPGGGEDPILDSPPAADNLLHYNEFGGTSLSPGQREILRSSPVLK